MEWSKIPSLSALRAFEAAARNQSFSQAARELNVTHAAIAQHVRSLENEFSETLIERQGRGVAVTDAGRQLAESLRDGFTTIADGVDDLRMRQQGRPLNISVTPAFANNWLMPRIGDFWQKYPGISISINPSADLVDLAADKFDLAVRYGMGNWPKLNSELLTNEEFWVVVHPDLVTENEINGLQDLTDLPWVLENQLIERRTIIEREGIDFDQINLTLLLTTDLVIAAASSGLGVTAQPKSIVQREINNGSLVKVCELPNLDLAYHMVTVPNRTSKDLRIFMAWLRRKARDA